MKKKVTVEYMVSNVKKCEEGNSGTGTIHKETFIVEFTPEMEKAVKEYRMNQLKGVGVLVATETFFLSLASLLGMASGYKEDGKTNLSDHPVMIGTFAVSGAFVSKMFEEAMWKHYKVDPNQPVRRLKRDLAYVKACEIIKKRYEDYTVIFFPEKI